ncbi:MAG: PIG-L family deacetylase [Candidatus Thermofonsia Clade 1 bacterium]|uniref:PIG-L family deacetylase n=1 Tax=Candidatus Thermofonsia Clade 1 bacterium TaxID=2364210 RepID=A0A2M8P3Q8_9CHLR|nr:MAG: PIG-L family deacetylase [Candidatus Thermofonsia Clade 1 bacterium]
MNVLAIGAHGDDLEIFCGGTLALCAQRGDSVTMCVVTDGRGRPKGDPDFIAAVRHSEAQAAAATIGATLAWLAMPDGAVVADKDSCRPFVELIRRVKPSLIITHPPEDYHPDHTAVSRLVTESVQLARTANFAAALPPHREPVAVYFMESERGIGFLPEEYVDISAVFALKLQMLRCHRSQFMPPTEPYDPNFVLPEDDQHPMLRMAHLMSGFRGLQADVAYAEAFRPWRSAGRILTRRLLP